MTDVLIEKGKLDVETHTYTERTPCKDEDRGHGDASTSCEFLKIVTYVSETTEEAWHRFFLMVLRRNPPCRYLDLKFLATRMRGDKLLLLKSPVCDTLVIIN